MRFYLALLVLIISLGTVSSSRAEPPNVDYLYIEGEFVWCRELADLKVWVELQKNNPTGASDFLKVKHSQLDYGFPLCDEGQIGAVQYGEKREDLGVIEVRGVTAHAWLVNVGNPRIGFLILWNGTHAKKEDS